MTIGYKTIGNGPQKVLFLHGWLSDYTVYNEIIPFFDGGLATTTREPYHSNGEKRYSGYQGPTYGTHWSHGTAGPMHNGPKPPGRAANSAPSKFTKILRYQ